MRLGWLVIGVSAGMLAGCAGSPTPAPSVTPNAAGQWVTVLPGAPTVNAGVTGGGSPRPGLPPISYLPTGSAGCTIGWPQDDRVLIPMVVTPVARGFRVQWPASYGRTYRLTAVHQGVVVGAQPQPTWQTVQAGGNCTVTATITGLISGDPYIVWLDAPDTPRKIDGSRSLRSGKTAVLHPL